MLSYSGSPVAGSGEKRRKPSWLILSLGFGGLLICIVAAAVGTLVTLQRVRNTEAHSRKAFLERLSALDQIRAQIYLSGTYVRDFLLSPDPDTAKAQAAHLATLKHETHNALDAYGRELEPEEREPFLALRKRDRRLLEGTRCHHRVVAAGTEPPAILVLLQRTGSAAHGHAADRGPHRLGERARPDALGGRGRPPRRTACGDPSC